MGPESSDVEKRVVKRVCTAGEQCDPCLHMACDDLGNVNPVVVETLAKSVARAVQYFGIEGQGF